MDDLSLPYQVNNHHPLPPERRARSNSPVKNRRSLPPGFFDMKLPSLPIASQEDLSSTLSTSTSLTSDQLRALSKSPISKKLHITSNSASNKYCIPIPFTLQLPPKLSPKNQSVVSSLPKTYKSSPNSSPLSKKVSRLVYTGSGYEKIDVESEDETLGLPGSPRSSRPPPRVKNNHTKASMLMVKSNLMSQDELSIIEEVSNCGSSRNSSVKHASDERSLPPLPGSLRRSPTRKPPPEPLQEDLKSPYKQKDSGVTGELVQPVPTPIKSHRHSIAAFSYPNDDFITSKQTSITGSFISKGYYEDHAGKKHSSTPYNFLKIHKRSFSDESQVSSVSSYSSVGDFMNLCSNPSVRTNCQPPRITERSLMAPRALKSVTAASRTPEQPVVASRADPEQSAPRTAVLESFRSQKIVHQPLAPAPPYKSAVARIASDSSESSSSSALSSSSASSWNSLQKSVDISLEDSVHSPYSEQFDFSKDKSMSREQNSETLPLHLSRSSNVSRSKSESFPTEEFVPAPLPVKTSTVQQPRAPVAIGETRKTYDSDNEGAGKRFSFPNSEANITNALEIKRAVQSSNSMKSHKSRFSHISANGQIEIPDLSDKSVAGSYTTGKSTCSYNGTTFDDLPSEADTSESSVSNGYSGHKLEPIGVPTRASKQLLRDQFRLMHNDDDSDTDLESNFYSASVESKSTPNLSLHQFAHSKEEASPAPPTSSPVRHRRNKSMFDINFNHNNFKVVAAEEATVPKPAVATKPKKMFDLPPEKLNIVVAEPPKKVNYAVDFKESALGDDFSRIPSSTPTVHEIYNVTIDQSSHSSPKELYLKASQQKTNRSTNNSENFKYNPKEIINQNKQTSQRRKSRSGVSLSRTRNVSNKSARLNASDASSVVIDLTEDKYDKCTIKRNDSVLSYRSVTEKTKEGKEVEVVLVDEDDDSKSRDDLSSIYSKYQSNWGVSRSDSTTSHSSTSSYESGASYNSGASSRRLILKPRAQTMEIYKQMQALRSPVRETPKMNGTSMKSNTSSANSASYESNRILMPSAVRVPEPKSLISSKSQPNLLSMNKKTTSADIRESNYFDYSNGESYDFNSFMKQRTVSKPN